jgi:hypothetical protein
MKSRIVSKRLSGILLACLVVVLMVNCIGCSYAQYLKKYTPMLGSWIIEKDPVTQVERRVGCRAGGNECAYIDVGNMQVEIPVSWAVQLIAWQSSAAQL